MTPESENFEQLRKLLALKRHEVPPPGYYNNFSREVISRIRAGDTAEPRTGISWVQRLWQALEMRPAIAGAFGLFVCAALTGGILYSATMEKQAAMPNLANFTSLPDEAATVPTSSSVAFAPGINSLSGTPQSSGLFDIQIQPQPASFHPEDKNSNYFGTH